MTRTAAPSTTSTLAVASPSGLRTLALIRVAFSVVWVVLVLATTSSLTTADRPTAVAAVLLVLYPLWDVVATLLDRRLTGSRSRITVLNMAIGAVAAVAMVVAVLSSVGTALVVFGVWAFLSGAIQLVVAIRRRRSVGAQWPSMISGGLSVVAGLSIASMAASATTGLSLIAGYSAFGAFWFLVAALMLSLRIRRSR